MNKQDEQRKTNVLLVYEELTASVRLCGYEQLRYLSSAGKLNFRFVRETCLTQELWRWADVLFFVRNSSWLSWEIAVCGRKAGKFMVYVLDDDLLHIVQGNPAEKYYGQEAVRNRIRWFVRNCDVFTSPSAYMLKKYQRFAGKSVRFVQIKEPCMSGKAQISRKVDTKKLKIGFAGSSDRGTDVERILHDVLVEFTQKHGSEAEIAFMGTAEDLAWELGAPCYAYEMNYDRYRKKFYALGWDVGLAPMPDCEFHRCKHYNKYLEYAAAGCVGIYSNVIPYAGVIKDKENGILAENTGQAWIAALEWCLNHREALWEMRQNIHTDMVKNYAIRKVSIEFLESVPDMAVFHAERKNMSVPFGLYRVFYLAVRVIEFIDRYGKAMPDRILEKIKEAGKGQSNGKTGAARKAGRKASTQNKTRRDIALEKWKLLDSARIKRLVRHVRKYGCRGLYDVVLNHLHSRVRYHDWFLKHRSAPEKLERQKHMHFVYEPKISILVPVCHTPVNVFQEMLASVTAQTYGNWELCIAGVCGANRALETELWCLPKQDPRIRCRILKKNQGISANTNTALEMASGEFVGLLDHDDILEPDALYEVVHALQDRDTDLVYTDEDKVSSDLTYFTDPNFKPDFSLDLLRSHNYITHFLVIRTSMLKEIGGFRSAFDGAQDYDLLLRCVERTRNIRHVARLLYHWRMGSGSTAQAPENKQYCYEAGRRALQEHLWRMGIKGSVACAEKPLWGFYHTRYETTGNPLISIVIANRDHTKDLERCICSIREKSTYQNFEFIIVENGSIKKNTFTYYEKLCSRWQDVKVVRWKGEFNYSAVNNYGVSHAAGAYVLLLNNDTELIAPDALGEMLGICMRSEVGAVGAKLLYKNGTVQHAGVVIGFDRYAMHVFHGIGREDYGFMMRARVNCNYSAVTGACLMTRRSVFEEVGGLTESLAVAANDVDYCLKVRERGYLVVYSAYAQWYHYESKTRGYEDTPEKVARYEREKDWFRERWADILRDGDPYYNRNFTLDTVPFMLEGYQ